MDDKQSVNTWFVVKVILLEVVRLCLEILLCVDWIIVPISLFLALVFFWGDRDRDDSDDDILVVSILLCVDLIVVSFLLFLALVFFWGDRDDSDSDDDVLVATFFIFAASRMDLFVLFTLFFFCVDSVRSS